jgi:hypothetical protein
MTWHGPRRRIAFDPAAAARPGVNARLGTEPGFIVP